MPDLCVIPFIIYDEGSSGRVLLKKTTKEEEKDSCFATVVVTADCPEALKQQVVSFANTTVVKTTLSFEGIINVTRRGLQIVVYCLVTAEPEEQAQSHEALPATTALFEWHGVKPEAEAFVTVDGLNASSRCSASARLALRRAIAPTDAEDSDGRYLFSARSLGLWLDGGASQLTSSMVCPGTEACGLDAQPPRRGQDGDLCLCVGDLHGRLARAHQLWLNASVYFGPYLEHIDVIFLGDFCDRGDDTRGVLSLLIWLQQHRLGQTHVIGGNHDFAMSAFLRLFPAADVGATSAGYQSWYREKLYEDTSGEKAHLGMHLQGRRWGATLPTRNDCIFEAAATFSSYGCTFPDRRALLDALPPSHKEFLRTLPWLVDLRFAFGRVLALHAGLENHKEVEPQLTLARERDCSQPFLEVIAGRGKCREAHPDLEGTDVIEVSGHFGFLDIAHPNRCIVDEGGGRDHGALAALVLPHRHVLRHNEAVQTDRCSS